MNLIEDTCAVASNLIICKHIFLNLGFFNSDLNPVLYVLVGKHFRKKMWEVMKIRDSASKSSSATRLTLLSSRKVNTILRNDAEINHTTGCPSTCACPAPQCTASASVSDSPQVSHHNTQRKRSLHTDTGLYIKRDTKIPFK
ncbi:hypothetical protein WMY93_032184 [Mugilogobius chulae]|uniref:Uncharacterized protein n=1 Tax=Mugilogobius chulae TaxID=88201 RepID=A0AAW0MK48_9GOBI